MGGPGGLGPPGGGVTGARQAAFAAIRNPLRGAPEAVGCRQGGDFPPPEYFYAFIQTGRLRQVIFYEIS
jgi:hypothetical protein